MNRNLVTTGLIMMTVSSIAIGFYALAFHTRLVGNPEFHIRFDTMPVASSMHVIGGAIVLLTGALQFWQSLRTRYPQLHRWLGRIYLSFVLIGGIGGLLLAPVSQGGVVAHWGFGILAVLWLFSGARAYLTIRAGHVAAHREWMMRNFSMAFGAVTLRIYLGLFAVAGIPFEEAYPAVAWLAWVPNLLLVEWYLALKREPQLRAAVAQPARTLTNIWSY
jgi:uncharacterized membrane protein